MCSDIGTTSRICAMYSFTGMLFTLFVGILLTAQPEFITGIEDVGEAKSNAFGAMGMFIGTLCLSVFGILRSNTNDKEEEDVGYQLSGMSNHQQTEEYTARYD